MPANASSIAKAGLTGLAGAMKDIAKQAVVGGSGLKNMSAGLGTVMSPVTAMTGAVKKFAQSLGAPIAAIAELGDTLGQMVGKSNPAMMEMFGIAMNDTMAALGRSMEPLVQGLTVAMEMLGDAFAGLEPSLKPVFEGISKMAKIYAELLVPVMQILSPLLDMYAVYLEALAAVMTEVVKVVAKMTEKFLEFFGVVSHFDKSKKGKGSAVRSFGITTSGDELQRRNAVKALSGSTNKEKVEEVVVEIPGWIQKIIDKLKDILEAISGFIDKIPSKPKTWEKVAVAANPVLGGAAVALNRMLL